MHLFLQFPLSEDLDINYLTLHQTQMVKTANGTSFQTSHMDCEVHSKATTMSMHQISI